MDATVVTVILPSIIADLGIDSIKRVEIFATLMEQNPALQSLDSEQREAAEMDGASFISRFIYLTLPHLARAMTVVILIQTIFLLGVYAEILVTTNGGPGYASTNLAFLIYRTALLGYDVGGASANNQLMQFQADLLRLPVDRPKNLETTAFGAAMMAGLGAGLYAGFSELGAIRRSERVANGASAGSSARQASIRASGTASRDQLPPPSSLPAMVIWSRIGPDRAWGRPVSPVDGEPRAGGLVA